MEQDLKRSALKSVESSLSEICLYLTCSWVGFAFVSSELALLKSGVDCINCFNLAHDSIFNHLVDVRANDFDIVEITDCKVRQFSTRSRVCKTLKFRCASVQSCVNVVKCQRSQVWTCKLLHYNSNDILKFLPQSSEKQNVVQILTNKQLEYIFRSKTELTQKSVFLTHFVSL
jgi:hypothetical protein